MPEFLNLLFLLHFYSLLYRKVFSFLPVSCIHFLATDYTEYYKCFQSNMERKNQSELTSLKQIQNLHSQVHSGEDCITFISLSHYEMHKLVHDQENFVNKVKSINNQAKKKIDVGAYKEALILLSEGEKILEYAAGSGKTIERELIICVLHNIASAYHKLWMLEKCVSYVQGLIFNLENHLTSLQNSVMSSNQKQEIVIAMQSLQMKHMLTTYSIRFCALNSQQYNHKQALAASKKAMGYIRSILTFDEHHIRSLFKKQKESDIRVDLKYRLLMEIIEFQSNINIKKHKDILKAAHFCLQIWNKSKEKNTSTGYAYLKNYSIGDFMDIKAKDYKSKGDKLTPQEEKEKQFQSSIVYKLLLLSISYFSYSTEMRLNVSETQYYSQIQKENGFHYKQAEIYHLLAIIIISGLVDFEMLYLKHVLNSYTNYFNSGLIDYKTVQSQSLDKVIDLISDNKMKSPVPGSTEIISSEEMLPESQNNEYRLKDKFFEKPKNDRKNFHKLKKKTERVESKRRDSKNFSSLEKQSIIKQDKLKFKGGKAQSKQKSKSKPKSSKSKTLQKKSKQRDNNYYFVKGTTSKSKKKLNYDELYNLSKKVSPKKSKEHFSIKEAGSQIVPKNQKKSVLTGKNSISKKLLSENRSPKKKNNIYGLQY